MVFGFCVGIAVNRMDIMKKNILTLLFFFCVSDLCAGIFDSYKTKSPEENIQDLAIEQINNPTDPYINYNLGVALYQTQKYDAAKNNFERAILHAKNNALKERCYFNMGNTYYKNALSLLPSDWENEKTKIDQEKLGKAIEDTKLAIKNYETLLELNKENTRVKPNLKKAKELLSKLQKKQEQQDQNQQNQKKEDQQNENENKNNQQDQQKQQQNQQDQKSENQSKQEQQQNNGQQQKNQDKSKDSSDQGQQGKNQNSENQQGQSEQKQDLQHDQKPSENKQEQKYNQDKLKEQQQQKQEMGQQTQEDQTQQKHNGAQTMTQGKEKDSAEKMVMRKWLENLQNDEENLQKAIIQRQTKDQKPLESGQKPW